MAFGWHYILVIGAVLLLITAFVLAPRDSSFQVVVTPPEQSTNITLPSLEWGAAFTTISWSGAVPSAAVQLFYCQKSICPYENASSLLTGRTNWTEFYGDTGSSGSISDYWNNNNPLPYIHFLVAAEGFSGSLTITVSTVYHNPGNPLLISGMLPWEIVGVVLGGFFVCFAAYWKIRR